MNRQTVERDYVEVVARRGLNERHFLRPDGQYQAIFSSHLNYLSNGKWEKREDYKLVRDGSEIQNNSDKFRVKVSRFKVSSGNDSFEVEGLYLDGVLIESPRDIDPEVLTDKVIYRDIFDGVDIEYLITPHKIKESIFIKKNLFAGRTLDGNVLSVRFKITGDTKFKDVWAKDGRGWKLDIKERRHGSTYSLGLDRATFNRALYPIEIDPTLSSNPSSDADVTSSGGRNNDIYLRAGYYFTDDGKGTITEYNQRAYLRFDLSSLAAATISDSTFYIYRYGEYSPGYDVLRQSAGEVDPETGNIATIYANANGTSMGSIPTGTGAYKSVSVTSCCQTHKGGFCDFGITGDETGGADRTSTFLSSEYGSSLPYLSITYSTGGGATTYTKTWTADGSIRDTFTKTATADGSVKETKTKTWTVDGVVKATYTSTATSDGIMKVISSTGTASDGVVLAQTDKTFTADASILATYTTEATSDAVIADRLSATTESDGIVLVSTNKTVTGDTILVNRLEAPITSDAIVRETFELTLDADSIVILQPIATFTADASVAETKSTSVTCDLWIANTIYLIDTTDNNKLSDNIDSSGSAEDFGPVDVASATTAKKLAFGLGSAGTAYGASVSPVGAHASWVYLAPDNAGAPGSWLTGGATLNLDTAPTAAQPVYFWVKILPPQGSALGSFTDTDLQASISSLVVE